MDKKFDKRILFPAILVVLLVALILSAIFLFGNNELVTLKANMISLEYTEIVYDGVAKTPEVKITLNNNEVSEEEYEVTYSENINAGTATVTVTAKENSKILEGSASVEFVVEKAVKDVATASDLKTAVVNENYISVNLTDDLEVSANQSVIIPAFAKVIAEDNVITNNGTIINNGTIVANAKILGTGTIINNNEVVAYVSTREALVDAFEYATHIILDGNISGVESDAYLGDIDVIATDRDYEFTLDLNGYTLGSELNLINWVSKDVYTNYSIDAKIVDSSEAQTGVLGNEHADCWYGLMVKGDNKINVTINNIVLKANQGGLYTNGNCAGAKITAQNCKFKGIGNGGVGAYLPARYVYNFTNCTFEGETGYYTKSGTHILVDCNMNGTGAFLSPVYNGNGSEPTGCGIAIDSATGYLQPMTVVISGCEITSTNGYGLEEFSTTKAGESQVNYATVLVMNGTVMSGAKGNYTSQNNVVTVEA